ncbi:hypothetical protein [Streptomyces sp. LARHCF252]
MAVIRSTPAWPHASAYFVSAAGSKARLLNRPDRDGVAIAADGTLGTADGVAEAFPPGSRAQPARRHTPAGARRVRQWR